jgi:hypothetical protein
LTPNSSSFKTEGIIRCPLFFSASDYPILWTFMVANLAVGIVLLYHGLGLGLGFSHALQLGPGLGLGRGRGPGQVN